MNNRWTPNLFPFGDHPTLCINRFLLSPLYLLRMSPLNKFPCYNFSITFFFVQCIRVTRSHARMEEPAKTLEWTLTNVNVGVDLRERTARKV